MSGRSGHDAADPLGGAALLADIVAYCAFGDHRTATDADIATSEWLANALRAAGCMVERKAFMVRQFFATREHLAIDGASIDCYPLWFPKAGRVRAPLRAESSFDLDGAIAYVRLVDATPADAAARVHAAVELGAKGVVVEAPLPSGEPFAFSAGENLPVPVLIAGAKDRERLDAAAREGSEAVIEIDGTPRSTQAYEVIGTCGDGDRHVVVSTPYSAWTRAAGERGPGIAVLLGLARRIATRAGGRGCRYTFVASSAHELAFAGMRHFLEHHAPRPERTHAWLHLGASIAVHDHERTATGYRRLERASRRTRLLTNVGPWLPALCDAFDGIEHLAPEQAATARGELRLVFEAGHRAFGFEGSHPYFHARRDVPELTVSAALLEPAARSIAAALDRVVETI